MQAKHGTHYCPAHVTTTRITHIVAIVDLGLTTHY